MRSQRRPWTDGAVSRMLANSASPLPSRPFFGLQVVDEAYDLETGRVLPSKVSEDDCGLRGFYRARNRARHHPCGEFDFDSSSAPPLSASSLRIWVNTDGGVGIL